jgi:hypothetical protein
MKKSIVACVTAGVLVFAACGSDSDGASGAQAEVADAAIEAAGEEGIALDEECVNDLASQLSDEDAEAIAAAGPDGDPEISDEGAAIGVQLMSCADKDEIVDAFIAQMETSGQDFDEACVREGLEDVDLTELAANPEGGAPEELVTALFECFELGS